MKLKIKDAVPFILKDGIKACEVNLVNGLHVVTTADGFKQNLKKSEYEALREASVLVSDSIADEPKASDPKEFDADVRREELMKMKKDDLVEIASPIGDIEGLKNKAELAEFILESEIKANTPVE